MGMAMQMMAVTSRCWWGDGMYLHQYEGLGCAGLTILIRRIGHTLSVMSDIM